MIILKWDFFGRIHSITLNLNIDKKFSCRHCPSVDSDMHLSVFSFVQNFYRCFRTLNFVVRVWKLCMKNDIDTSIDANAKICPNVYAVRCTRTATKRRTMSFHFPLHFYNRFNAMLFIRTFDTGPVLATKIWLKMNWFRSLHIRRIWFDSCAHR